MAYASDWRTSVKFLSLDLVEPMAENLGLGSDQLRTYRLACRTVLADPRLRGEGTLQRHWEPAILAVGELIRTQSVVLADQLCFWTEDLVAEESDWNALIESVDRCWDKRRNNVRGHPNSFGPRPDQSLEWCHFVEAVTKHWKAGRAESAWAEGLLHDALTKGLSSWDQELLVSEGGGPTPLHPFDVWIWTFMYRFAFQIHWSLIGHTYSREVIDELVRGARLDKSRFDLGNVRRRVYAQL